jgi:hypothetical protein
MHSVRVIRSRGRQSVVIGAVARVIEHGRRQCALMPILSHFALSVVEHEVFQVTGIT